MLNLQENTIFNRISAANDFEVFRKDFIKFPYINGEILSLEKFRLVEVMESLMDTKESEIIFQIRPRQMHSKTFILTAILYDSLYSSDGRDKVLVVSSKIEMCEMCKRILDIIDHTSVINAIPIISELTSRKECYWDIKITSFTGVKSTIRVMFHNYQNPGYLIQTSRELNIRLLCPIDAPYTPGYDVIRSHLAPNLYNNRGKELILSNGGNVSLPAVKYFKNLENFTNVEVIDIFSFGLTEDEIIDRFKHLDCNLILFAKEYLCLYVDKHITADDVKKLIPQYLIDVYDKHEIIRQARDAKKKK